MNDITLCRAIIVFCRTDNILRNNPHIQFECEEYSIRLTMMFYGIFLTFNLNVKISCRVLSVPQNIVMALNNVMDWINLELDDFN